jgi:hypothetical protein
MASILKMDAVCSFEILGKFSTTTWCQTPYKNKPKSYDLHENVKPCTDETLIIS